MSHHKNHKKKIHTKNLLKKAKVGLALLDIQERPQVPRSSRLKEAKDFNNELSELNDISSIDYVQISKSKKKNKKVIDQKDPPYLDLTHISADTSLDNFIKYINHSVKAVGRMGDTTDTGVDIDDKIILEQNNNLLYFLAKTTMQKMAK